MLAKYFIFFGSVLGLLFGLSPNMNAASHKPQQFLTKVQGSKDEGAQIVLHFCATCHAAKPAIELGAPKIGDKNAWSPRLKQGKALLLQHTIEGIGAMPARGGCFECSDEQLDLAIAFMLLKS